MPLRPGRQAHLDFRVGDADTSISVGSGDVPVLATPRVLAMLEAATVQAVAADLSEGESTVGAAVELRHRAATPVGRHVRAEARLISVAGRSLSFEVQLTDGGRVVADGRIDRVLVDRAEFLARALWRHPSHRRGHV